MPIFETDRTVTYSKLGAMISPMITGLGHIPFLGTESINEKEDVVAISFFEIGFVSSGTHSVLLKPMGVVNSVAFHFIEIGLVFSVPLLV